MTEDNTSFELIFPVTNFDTASNVTEDLVRGLPDYYDKSQSSGNYTLLNTAGKQLSASDGDIDTINAASKVKEAKSIAELRAHGELVGVKPKPGETISEYRARLIGEFHIVTCEGTPKDVIESAAKILEISEDAIGYTNAPNGEGGAVQLDVPKRAFTESDLSSGQLATLLDKTVAASYRVDAITTGTFTYITPQDYNDGNSDASKGYDGLDANGDPKDNGGTYSGVLA